MIYRLGLFNLFLLVNCVVSMADPKVVSLKNPTNNKVRQSVSMGLEGMDISLPVEKYQLKNGLTVLLNPDHRIPHIYHLLVVKVGSVNEQEGKTGLAHLFEHIMFRGTRKFSDDEYERKLSVVGARNNAFTSRDMTAYLVDLPKKHLEMVLDMESDRLHNLIIDKATFEKELEVVKEERRMRTDNDPGDVFEPMMKLVYPKHAYSRPILGWMQDLEKMKVPTLQKFYKTHYAPNNAILVLAGDFNSKTAKKLIQKYYGPLKPFTLKKARPKPKKNPLPPANKRTVTHKRAVQAPTVAFAWRAPPAGSPHSYNLDIISLILAGGKSGRLQQLLVYQKRIALSVSSFYYDLKEKSVFFIIVRLAPRASVSKVKSLVLNEIKKIRSLPVSDKELLKSKRAIMHHFISLVKSLEGKAHALGETEMLYGDYTRFLKDLQRYHAIKVNDIKKAALEHLSQKEVFTVDLIPSKKAL